MRIKTLALSSLCLLGSLCIAGNAMAAGVSISEKLPQELKSFKGTLYGRVISKDEKNGHSFVLKISSHPSNPRGEMGMEFRIRVSHSKDADGKNSTTKAQRESIKKLRIGDDISVTVQSDEEDTLNLVEFPGDKKPKASS